MKQDFHYCCIAVLARAAGFEPNDALTIAYASQYVDDSFESDPIRVGDLYFDPVRTAHRGLRLLRALDWSAQKRVFIPFHFLPRRPLRASGDSFLTEPAGEFAAMIWQQAQREDPARLCAMGIALHTIADAWAHRGFSGREHRENDVEAIYHQDQHGWNHVLLPNAFLDLLPTIGHAQAGTYPDESWLTWKWRQGKPKTAVQRNNADEFLAAAKHIYGLLCRAKKPKTAPVVPWHLLWRRIRSRLVDQEENVRKRCKAWAEEFNDLLPKSKFGYDENDWKMNALRPKRHKDIQFKNMRRSDYHRLRFPKRRGFYQTSWVHFHRAALRQRHLVLENLL